MYVYCITFLSLDLAIFLFTYFACFGVNTLCFTLMLYFFLQRLYKKSAKDGFGKFTLDAEFPDIALAKINAANLSDVCKNLKFKRLNFKKHINTQ